MGSGSIQLARVFGIRIGASPSWFLVLFIMIYGLSGYFGDVLAGYRTRRPTSSPWPATLLFFISLILHELGHALVARRNGIGISGIDLWFFGGLAKMTRDTSSPGEEFRVAAAGPAVTLVIVALCYGAALVVARAGDFLDSATLDRDPDDAGDRAGGLAGRHQRLPVRVQHGARVPAGRRAHRPRRGLEADRRPQPRRRASRPGSGRPSPTC